MFSGHRCSLSLPRWLVVGIEKVWEAAKAEVEAGFSRLPAAAVPGNAGIQQCCTQLVPEGRLLKANGANY